MKTVFWDIESGDTQAQCDQVYCAGFKPYREEAYLLTRKATDTTDKKLCIDIRKELAKYDIIVSYYGLNFDKPFLNSRLLKQDEKPLPRQLHIDCYRLAKKIFKYTIISRRLISICELLHIEGKTRVEFDNWEVFKYGSPSEKKAALWKIGQHCLWDVTTLEKAFDKCFKHEVVSVSLA